MGSAANQVAVIQLLELVMRAEVEHLGHAMRQVKGGAKEDARILPVSWCDDAFNLDMRANIAQRGARRNRIQHQIAEVSFVQSMPLELFGTGTRI